jgi:glutathione synthase/RimK-type ligase-like ATP-grasp enzyme
MPTIALATWSELPNLSDDDQLLAASLRGLGARVVPAVWSAPETDWSGFDLVVIRSTWDYYRRIEEFLEWVDRVASKTSLLNPARLLRWNSHKTYLRDLERAGVPVIPTLWGSEIASVTGSLESHGWTEGVLKPAVSAAGVGVHRVSVDRRDENEAALARLRDQGEVLLQPYVPSVEDPGERSLVFLDGEYSHAALKEPKLSGASQIREGDRVAPTADELAVAERAVRATRIRPLYARVDLVPYGPGDPRLMELEVLEPALFLASAPGSADNFAAAVLRRL